MRRPCFRSPSVAAVAGRAPCDRLALPFCTARRAGAGDRPCAPGGKILAINDFEGAFTPRERVANRPVGGAAVLAAYLKAAQADSRAGTVGPTSGRRPRGLALAARRLRSH